MINLTTIIPRIPRISTIDHGTATHLYENIHTIQKYKAILAYFAFRGLEISIQHFDDSIIITHEIPL